MPVVGFDERGSAPRQQGCGVRRHLRYADHHGRVFKLTTQLQRLLKAQEQQRDRVTKASGVNCPWAFFRMVARAERRRKEAAANYSLNKAWANAGNPLQRTRLSSESAAIISRW